MPVASSNPLRRAFDFLRPRPPDPPPPGEEPPPPPELNATLWVGLAGAVLAGLLSYLDTRSGQEALPDLRGGFGLGVDTGSWITTAFIAGELAIVPLTPWLAGAVTPRRAFAFAVPLAILAGAACPEAPNFASLVGLRFLQGMGDGMIIPLLLLSILTDMPGPRRVWGLAVYALVVNLPATLVEPLAGLWTDRFTWKGLFWQNVLPGAVALGMILVGLPRHKPKLQTFADADYFGMFCLVAALVMLVVALGQGQRLDWFDSGLVSALCAGAAFFAVAFVINERLTAKPFLDLALLGRRNFSIGLLMFLVFTAAQLSTLTVVPEFSSQIQGFRETQIGAITIWFAPVELLLPFLAAWLLQRVDLRIVLGSGLCLGAMGNYLSAYVTSDYAAWQIIPGQAMLAVSWPFIIMGLAISTTSVIGPKDILTGGVLFNSMRNLAASVGTAVTTAIFTVRERVHSNEIVQHLRPGAEAPAPAIAIQAYVQAFADTYGWIAVVMLIGVALAAAQNETRIARS